MAKKKAAHQKRKGLHTFLLTSSLTSISASCNRSSNDNRALALLAVTKSEKTNSKRIRSLNTLTLKFEAATSKTLYIYSHKHLITLIC